MNYQSVSKNFILFNIGMLVSSIGSMTFLVTVMASMAKQGYGISEIGFFVGAFRFLPTLFAIVLGTFFLKIAHLKLYIPLEIASFFLSLLLAFLAFDGKFNIYIFTLIAVLRATLALPQRANRPGIIKYLESTSNLSRMRPILWLNKMTHGATFFSAIIALLGISVLTLSDIIIFDGITFLISAVFSFRVIQSIPSDKHYPFAPNIHAPNGLLNGAFLLMKKIPFIIILDALLATIMIGANMFSVRISGKQETLIPLLLLSYGLSVWIGGYLIRFKNLEKKINIAWFTIAIGFISIGFFPGQGLKTWTISFVCDLSYWLLFHFITEKIQSSFELNEIESVHYSRNSFMMLYLALGEFAVGGWSNSIPLHIEGIIRGSIALLALAFIWIKHDKTSPT